MGQQLLRVLLALFEQGVFVESQFMLKVEH